jgi:hypothetical protein
MKGTLWLFRTKDYICREGCKEGFYIRKAVLFIEGKSSPQFKMYAGIQRQSTGEASVCATSMPTHNWN